MAGFPIFVDISRNAPLIVGGGELAALKGRLLLKRADNVVFATDSFCYDIQELVKKGRATLIGAHPGVLEIKGRPLVISAQEDDAKDAQIFKIASAFGVPVNVPDRPELCTFSLPAIVDRGLLTIAIGTEGAAPMLATRLRAMFEQQLHPKMGRLAQFAREYRKKVAKALPPGKPRRAFWERVFGGDIANDVLAGEAADARHKLETALIESTQGKTDRNGTQETMGRVYLIGAGPGDPDLMTLKGVRALKSADVILTDFLVGEHVLDHARREARIVNVGKAPGRHSKTQAEINALILSFAREGLTVVRLKGGDPFVFGRGGEEVEMLRASGVSCQVIPGISAAMAAAASLQIPLTHREFARSVTFVSGHAAGNGKPDFSHLNFAALARDQCTLVAYMAVATAGDLANALIKAGWSKAMPVIAVERASYESERRVQTTLDILAADPKRLQLKGPALLICGEVAGLTPRGDVEFISAEEPFLQTLKGSVS